MNEVTVDKRFAILFILAFLLSACGLGDRAAAPTVAPTMPAPTATAAPATEAPLTEAPPAPAGEPDEQALGQAYIGSLRLSVLESFPVRVQAHIGGDLSDGCTNIAGVGVGRDGQTFRIQVVATRDPAAVCTQALVPFERTVELETRGLAAGAYTVVAGDLSESFTLAVDNVAAEVTPQPTPDLAAANLYAGATSASPGSLVALNGAGFPAGATVQIGIGPQGSEYDIVDATQAGADGRFTAQVQVPEYAEIGQAWVFVAEVDGGKVIAEPLAIVAAEQTPEAGVNQAVDGLFRRTNIFLIAIGDNGQGGPLIGCQDSAVPVVVEIEPTVAPMTAAIQRLLAIDSQFYGQSGLYNVFYQSDLQLEGINLVDGQATIALSGTLTLGGACDNPRVLAQLQQTALQYSTVDSAVITLNGQPLESVLQG
ncbi:MAG: GerMN domain-containing protein [Candidatus Promineifilaceae bacterium]